MPKLNFPSLGGNASPSLNSLIGSKLLSIILPASVVSPLVPSQLHNASGLRQDPSNTEKAHYNTIIMNNVKDGYNNEILLSNGILTSNATSTT